MFDVLLQMAGLILCGTLWRFFRPGDIEPDLLRRGLSSLVYHLLLPALVLGVLWQAPLGSQSLWIVFLAFSGVLFGLGLGWLSCRIWHLRPAVTGAVILAAAFPNATYLGLPVLEATLGTWSRAVAIQYDLFACTPLLLSAGVLIARHYGHKAQHERFLRGLFKVPPLWAALLALGLNLAGVEQPALLEEWLLRLGQGVSLLMLLALGMSLQWDNSRWKTLPTLLPVLLIQLLLTPALVWLLGSGSDLEPRVLQAVVLEAAMPSMVIGIVLCDRFGLDTTLYATTVTVTTAASLLSLPLWFGWLGIA